MRGSVTVVLDGQAGSCGKGKVVGFIALKDNPGVAINNFMSNAGHTFVQDGGAVMTQHLPTSIVNKDTILCIGPGAAITPEILGEELIRYEYLLNNRRVYVHPRAMVIKEKHRLHEKEVLRSGSTFKGCGSAQTDKTMRTNVELFGDWLQRLACTKEDHILDWAGAILRHVEVQDTAEIVNKAIDDGLDVLVEGSQGFDLDINYGLDYPHTTSRQCHVGQLVADCGISPLLVDEIIMVVRPYPIRISNQTDIGVECNSGDYAGSPEITWDIVKQRCGAPTDVQFGEMTTVTKKLRRVFEMNWERLGYAARINRPTQIVLNFAQYLDYSINGLTTEEYENELVGGNGFDAILDFTDKVRDTTGVPVTMIGTGSENDAMVDLRWDR